MAFLEYARNSPLADTKPQERGKRSHTQQRVRVGGYIVNLLDFYSYRLIGKLTAFLQLQEFNQRNLPVDSSLSSRGFLTGAQKESWSDSR
jgi:hypothetical protein